ncbi:TrlF family AAA-like ATPase [Haloferax sp. Atlit-12N]|uniref:TrlF family AAA-like ATPase n=1 Tax=Haloferax sp. Atlit-12N TaxID=2077203 RepID=UPI0011E5B099|nr:hypothetical protein [Haloferax sp. Atlit-12N]
MNSRRGSEWRKWDLHVHTPASFEHQYQFNGDEEVQKYDSDQWNKYLSELENVSDISVLGITDYFSIDGYKRILKEREQGRVKNFDTVLPNIEFRLSDIVTSRKDSGDTKRVNLHVIFSQDIHPDEIERKFLNGIKFDARGTQYSLSRENLQYAGKDYIDSNQEENHLSNYEAGCKIATVNFNEITDALDKPEFKGEFMLILATGVWGDIEWTSQGHGAKERLFRKTDALFSANSNQIDWALGKADESKEAFNRAFGDVKPCLHGSDAHRYERLCRPDDDKYCWIKADPTFEGLKQTMYEPERRVKIQSDKPDGFTPIHSLSGVSISNGNISDNLEIADNDIPLNNNLVTVIGGKGAGKTALLDLISNCFEDRCARPIEDYDEPDDQNSFVQRIQSKRPSIQTKIEFNGNDVEDFSKELTEERFFESAEFVYLPQGQIEEYCRNEERLHKHILQVIKRNVNQSNPEMINRFDQLHKEAEEHADEFRSKTSKIYELDPDKITGNKEELQKEISRAEGRLKSKKAEINSFEQRHSDELKNNSATRLKEQKKELESGIEQITNTISDVQGSAEELSRVQKLNSRLEDIESQLSDFGIGRSIERIPIGNIPQTLDTISEELDENLSSKKDEKAKVEKRITELTDLEQDYSKLLDELENINNEISELESELSAVNDRLDRLEEFRKYRRTSFIEYLQKYIEIRNQYQTVIDQFSSTQTSILEEISFEPSVNISDDLKQQLSRLLDGRSINDSDIDAAIEHLQNALEREVPQQQAEDVEKFLNSVEELQKDKLSRVQDIDFESAVYDTHLDLVEEIYFRSSPMQSLSLGQKGTVLLKILLAEEETPLIIDQPEENLDNQFIYETLVGAFRDAKLKRQVIIATHNANLVVNTDAEQVVVADYDDNTINFESGGLENSEIREKVTTILEGGTEAFQRREQRYGLE